MACTYEVWVARVESAEAEHAAAAVFAEVDRIEQELSRFVLTSDVSRINRLRAGQSAVVGLEAAECLRRSQEVARETGGAFDVCYASGVCGPVKPSDANTAEGGCATNHEADAAGGDCATHGPAVLRLLDLDFVARRVTALADGVKLDFGGIGKGYALDCAVELLRDWGVRRGLVHSGQSTVRATDLPEGEAGWRLAIRDPRDQETTLGDVRLNDLSLAGSGQALHGEHIIDPRTGKPVARRPGTWALAPTAAVADALSTAFMVMSVDEVEAYCAEHREVSALLLETSGDDVVRRAFGSGFAEITGVRS